MSCGFSKNVFFIWNYSNKVIGLAPENWGGGVILIVKVPFFQFLRLVYIFGTFLKTHKSKHLKNNWSFVKFLFLLKFCVLFVFFNVNFKFVTKICQNDVLKISKSCENDGTVCVCVGGGGVRRDWVYRRENRNGNFQKLTVYKSFFFDFFFV